MEDKDKLEVITLIDVYLILLDIRKLLGLNKTILTTEEAASYLGISVHTLNHYKSENLVSHHKPNGKLTYFLKDDLDIFAMQNRVPSTIELCAEAIKHI